MMQQLELVTGILGYQLENVLGVRVAVVFFSWELIVKRYEYNMLALTLKASSSSRVVHHENLYQIFLVQFLHTQDSYHT